MVAQQVPGATGLVSGWERQRHRGEGLCRVESGGAGVQTGCTQRKVPVCWFGLEGGRDARWLNGLEA